MNNTADYKPRMPNGNRRWLLHAALLLLFAWTWTETVPLTIRVTADTCTAVLQDRSSQIPCPGLDPDASVLYQQQPDFWARLRTSPLAALTPPAVWSSLTRQDAQTRAAPADATPRRGQASAPPSFTLTASLRRPDGAEAGVLLLQPGGAAGWLFLVDSAARRGVWWRWENDAPATPIRGIPYQKPLLAQAQSLLRLILAGYLGALLLWLLHRGLTRLFAACRLRPAAHRRWTARWAMLPVIWLIFGSALWTADTLLERVPHVQDSVTFLFQAQTLARGRLFAPPPPLPEAFAHEFLFVLGDKWFGQYPPGFAAVLAGGVWLGQPWVVNPLLAALTAPLLYALGRQLYGRRAGLLAALLAAVSPFFLLMSGSLMVHPAELFWTTLFLLAAARAAARPARRRRALLAGAALGMLGLTRQLTAVAVGGPTLALLLVFHWRNGRFPARRALLAQGARLLAAALPFALLLLAYQHALTGSPWQDPRLLGRPFDRPGFGAATGEQQNAFTLTQAAGETAVAWYTDPTQPPRGHTVARGLYNTQQNWRLLASHLFGWYPLFTLAFGWFVFVWRRPAPADWLLLAVLLSVVAVYVAYWADGIMYGPRYYYAALPALLLLTARGVGTLGRDTGHAGRLALAALLLLLVAGNAAVYLPTTLDHYRDYNFIGGQTQRQVAAAVAPPALVFVAGEPLNWWEYGRFFSANTPWLDGPVVYARDLGAAQNAQLRAAFPNRRAYRWDTATQTLHPLTPSPPHPLTPPTPP